MSRFFGLLLLGVSIGMNISAIVLSGNTAGVSLTAAIVAIVSLLLIISGSQEPPDEEDKRS